MLSVFSGVGEWWDAESPWRWDYGEYECDEYGAGVRRNAFVHSNVNSNASATDGNINRDKPAATDGNINRDKPAATDGNIAAAHCNTTAADAYHETIRWDDLANGDGHAQATNGDGHAQATNADAEVTYPNQDALHRNTDEWGTMWGAWHGWWTRKRTGERCTERRDAGAGAGGLAFGGAGGWWSGGCASYPPRAQSVTRWKVRSYTWKDRGPVGLEAR